VIDHEDARLQLADLVVPGLADPTRTAALRAHVAVCADCRSELEDLRYVDGLVRAGGPLPEPSAELEARIREIAGPVPPRRAPTLRQHLQSIRVWRVAAIGFAVATVALAIAAFTGGDSSDSFHPLQQRALTAAAGWTGASGTVATGTVGGAPALRIELRDVKPPSNDEAYEVWIAQTPQSRISLGTIAPDASGRATVTLPLPAAAAGYKRVWVTSEPADGNPKWTSNWIVRAS
jgi:anti-sigma-K factor RskA